MFAWKEKRHLQEQAQKFTTAKFDGVNANRRAIGLVPLPTQRESHEIGEAKNLKYHQLLISIEARQSTCCLRIMSSSKRSRAAIMIFRGRVLGCIYGSKGIKGQLFGEEAYEHALSDLSSPDIVIDAYVLSDELMLASAALFHGDVLEVHPDAKSQQVFNTAVDGLSRSKSPGCVVISTCDNLAVCMLYFFGGRMIGLYSFQDGWVEASYASAQRYMLQTPDPMVSASALAAPNVDEVMRLTFGLTQIQEMRPKEMLLASAQ